MLCSGMWFRLKDNMLTCYGFGVIMYDNKRIFVFPYASIDTGIKQIILSDLGPVVKSDYFYNRLTIVLMSTYVSFSLLLINILIIYSLVW
jgi:hypothetical protein